MVRGKTITNKFFTEPFFTINQFVFLVKVPGRFKVGRLIPVDNKRASGR